MNNSDKLTFSIYISPCEINTINFKKYMCNTFNNNIYDGKYINEIINLTTVNYGKIISNGYINVDIEAICDIIDLQVESVYSNIIITNCNKLGSFVNIDKISVFIPKEYSIKNQILETGSTINFKIVGKRIDDKITCIGQEV